MRHLYKLTGFDGTEAEILADNYHREDDDNVFVTSNGNEVARVPVMQVAMIRTTAA